MLSKFGIDHIQRGLEPTSLSEQCSRHGNRQLVDGWWLRATSLRPQPDLFSLAAWTQSMVGRRPWSSNSGIQSRICQQRRLLW